MSTKIHIHGACTHVHTNKFTVVLSFESTYRPFSDVILISSQVMMLLMLLL